MKKIILFAFILTEIFAYAQTPFSKEIKFGEMQKIKTKFQYMTILGQKEDKFYGINKIFYNYNQFYLSAFNESTLSKNQEYKLKLAYKGNKLEFVDALIFGNELIYLATFNNLEKQRKYIFILKDLGNGEVSIPELVGSTNWVFKNNSVNRAVNFVKSDISENRKYLTVVFPKNIDPNKDEENSYSSVVFNSDLKVEWKKEFNLSSYHMANNAMVNDNGTVFIESIISNSNEQLYMFNNYNFYDVFDSKFNNRIKREETHVEIVNSKTQKHIDLMLENKSFSCLKMFVKDNFIYFFGLSSNNTMNKNNSFLMILNENGDVINKEYLEIKSEFLTSKIYNRNGLSSYYIKNFDITENGSLIFTIEEFQYDEDRIRQGNQENIVSNFEYGNILIFNFNNTGKLNWTYKYEKTQRTTNDFGYFSSYFTMIKGNEIFLLMNKIKNQNPTGNVKKMTKYNTVVSCAKLDQNSKLTEEVLLPEAKLNYNKLCLRYGLIANQKFISTAYNRLNYKPSLCISSIDLNQ